MVNTTTAVCTDVQPRRNAAMRCACSYSGDANHGGSTLLAQGPQFSLCVRVGENCPNSAVLTQRTSAQDGCACASGSCRKCCCLLVCFICFGRTFTERDVFCNESLRACRVTWEKDSRRLRHLQSSMTNNCGSSRAPKKNPDKKTFF